MTYLITGGTGFLGSYIARHLLEAGHRVSVCDVSLDGDVVSLMKTRAQPGKLKIVQADVTKKGVANRLVENQAVTAIIQPSLLLSARISQHSRHRSKVCPPGLLRRK